MSTLGEIEQAARNLPVEDRQRLMLWLAQSLRADGAQLPSPRQFSQATVQAWIAEDENDLRQFLGAA